MHLWKGFYRELAQILGVAKKKDDFEKKVEELFNEKWEFSGNKYSAETQEVEAELEEEEGEEEVEE